jgi:hypothetical protein
MLYVVYPCYFDDGGSATHKRLLGPKGFDQKQTRAHLSLSSIIAPQAPKLIFDLHHQNLREKAANFNWRADSLISKVKRAFGSCLAGVLEFITLGALLLAG